MTDANIVIKNMFLCALRKAKHTKNKTAAIAMIATVSANSSCDTMKKVASIEKPTTARGLFNILTPLT